jgi:hypothetical protein
MYQQFGNSWRIKPSESLFHYWPGESSAQFTDLTFPTKPFTTASLPPATRSRAEVICRAVGIWSQPTLDACILDVGVTGSPAMAAASLVAAGTPIPVAATPGAGPAPATPTGAGTYAIKIGDTVSPDQPTPGAGIATPAQNRQTYTFQAHAGAIVYVENPSCQGAPLDFNVYDPTNRYLNGRIGCGGFGPVTLPTAGVYRLVVHADTGTARYTVTVRPTTADTYPIKIGDTVSPDHPASGAGIIARLGERQTYTFPAHAGDIVYVQVGPCEGAILAFDLVDPTNRDLGGHASCGDFGPLTLSAAGTYRIQVRSDQGTARYTFTLRTTTFDRYTIKIGDTVSANRPASGAGIIAVPGQQQEYSFRARAGQVISIHAGQCDGAPLGFDVYNAANQIVGGKGGCGDFLPIKVRADGVYRLVVHADRGTARFTLVTK